MLSKNPEHISDEELSYLNFEETVLTPLIQKNDMEALRAAIGLLDSRLAASATTLSVARLALFPTLRAALSLLPHDSASFPALSALVAAAEASPTATRLAAAAAASLPQPLDSAQTGILAPLKELFSRAIAAAFPAYVASADWEESVVTVSRCGNASHGGDYQCNSALALTKRFKALAGYSGPKSPRDIAAAIVKQIDLFAPLNSRLVASLTAAPNGFINIVLSDSIFQHFATKIIADGKVCPPATPPRKILVDFSSPNIAKEMHVGHLRSTIIGDALCRIMEFCQHDVMRVNHVGDWGTQFGMLISYLQETYKDILGSTPNISDLTVIYKESKKRFDNDEAFKTLSRNNVVKLQAGDPDCRAIWQLLCDISRLEFQKVYDILGVELTEVGESFYNPFIPTAIDLLREKGLIVEEEGMLISKLEHFEIPLILRKSDGGYGYDGTDMAALRYRSREMQRDWLVYITDAGQAPHFHMCFDVARKAGWLDELPTKADHIGFGVVCGDDGKRFKTRSSETVRLVDLLDAAKDRMAESLHQRAQEGKSPLQGEELVAASKIIGYGAVKYFDLKQHPSTNYIFSYDRMLDTKGDTAVYLLFAYARLASILRKAQDERGISLNTLGQPLLGHPAERVLAMELLQFPDVISSVLAELLPNRLCDFLHTVAVTFTDFVTKCHVLNAEDELTTRSRLALCLTTQKIMAATFSLLGIGTLERI